ncbi:MAG: hypothetical protein HKN68_00445 [Saprospiraceae bacterium]|nr:hypothetical protein [Saprospiraceae bacterium]
MKKRLLMLFAVLAAFSLTAFVYVNWNHNKVMSDLISDKSKNNFETYYNVDMSKNDFEIYYNVDNRWGGMTKAELKKKVCISEILSDDGRYTGLNFKNVTISILHNDQDVRDIKQYEMSQSDEFNDAQLKLLNSCDYSTNLRFTALNTWTDTQTGYEREDSLLRYMTIIPEIAAEYEGGVEALIQYLREASSHLTESLTKDKLMPGKFHFTVMKDGTVSDINMETTSGYSDIDKALMDILADMPEKWIPAQDGNGNNADQELVFSFGIQGC